MTFILEFGNLVPAYDDVFLSKINGSLKPAEKSSQCNRILVYLLWLVYGDVSFEELELLVIFILTFLGTIGVILPNSFEKLLIDEVLGELPLEFVSVALANLVSLVAEEIENSLEHTRHLDNI